MALRHTLLIAPILLAIGACETAQENPNYRYSSTYGEPAPQQFAQNSRHPDQEQTQQVQATPVRYVRSTPAQSQPFTQASANTHYATNSYSTTYTRVNHACLDQERRRELIGAGLGGTVGAIAGKKLIGGTKGTLIGAAAGGTAGYGLGNASIKCEPVQVHVQSTAPAIAPAYVPQATTHAASSHSYTPQSYAQPSSTATYSPSPTESAYHSDTVGTPGYEAIRQSQLSADASTAAPSTSYTAPSYAQPSYEAYTAAEAIVPAAAPVSQEPWSNSYNELGASYTVQEGDTVYSLSRNVCSTVSELKTLNNLDQDFTINAGQNLQLPASKC